MFGLCCSTVRFPYFLAALSACLLYSLLSCLLAYLGVCLPAGFLACLQVSLLTWVLASFLALSACLLLASSLPFLRFGLPAYLLGSLFAFSLHGCLLTWQLPCLIRIFIASLLHYNVALFAYFFAYELVSSLAYFIACGLLAWMIDGDIWILMDRGLNLIGEHCKLTTNLVHWLTLRIFENSWTKFDCILQQVARTYYAPLRSSHSSQTYHSLTCGQENSPNRLVIRAGYLSEYPFNRV